MTPAEEIKEKLDVVDVLKEYISLKPAGKNYKALCPFHSEKTPSFMVSLDRQAWHCFGCGEGGDIFTFLMKYENLEFAEALRILAEKAGVELRKRSPQEYRQYGLLYDINEEATRFFKEQLAKSAKAKEYLKNRGLNNASVKEFAIGWAPDGKDDLTVHLIDKGFSRDDIIRAGLALKSRNGLVVDRFRSRIMFPIHNHSGKTVAFTGRILPGEEKEEGMQAAKYLNSPETTVFKKSRILYGFSLAKKHIREQKTAFVVEGQMDAVLSWQIGIKNVVATSGTALTAAHLKPLKRLADTLIFSFDSDEAGLSALERAITLAQSRDFSVRLALCGKWDDPADIAVEDPDALKDIVKNAVSAPEFYFERYLPKEDIDFSNRKHLSALRTVLAKLASIASPVEQSHWVKKLSERTDIAEDVLAEEFLQVDASEVVGGSARKKKDNPQPQTADQKNRWERLSEKILALAFAENDLDRVDSVVSHLAPPYRRVYHSLCEGKTQSEEADLDKRLHIVVLSAENENNESFSEVADHLKQEYIRWKRAEITKKIKQAEQSGNEEDLQAALMELQELSSKK